MVNRIRASGSLASRELDLRRTSIAGRVVSYFSVLPNWLLLGIAVSLLVAGVGLWKQATQPQVEPGEEIAVRSRDAADFSLPDFSGQTVRLSQYRGRPVLVNLWASWCPPCRAEMPELVRYYEQHQGEGLVLLAVDSMDTREKALAFMKSQSLPFPVLSDPKGQVMDAFGVQGLPSSFLIDRNGVVRFAWTGQITPGLLNARVSPLLIE